MKFTITTALVAALAAVPSVFAAPAAALVGVELPSKFTLKVTTPTSGTALEKYLGQITVDSYGSQYLNIGTGSNQKQVPVILFRDGDSGFHVENTDGLGNWPFSISSTGKTIFWAGGNTQPTWPKTGFGTLVGSLVFNANDGKGPQALWSACPDSFFGQLWGVYWNPASTIKGCIPIGLAVVPL